MFLLEEGHQYIINNDKMDKLLNAFYRKLDYKHYFVHVNNPQNHSTLYTILIIKEGKKIASLACLDGVFHKETNLYKENKALQLLLDIANLCSLYFYKEVHEVN